MEGRTTPALERVEDYCGQASVRVQATQLEVSRSTAARVVREWCDFFAAGPSPIRELEFTSRTPKRLLDSLRGQSQLERLELKWGAYSDLTALTAMQHLVDLRLGGASSVSDLAPLADLAALRRLELEDTRKVRDYAPVGQLTHLEELGVSPSIWGPTLHADSLAWLPGLSSIRSLTFAVVVDDLDYSPVLELDHAEHITLLPVGGMRPTLQELAAASHGVRVAEREHSEYLTHHLEPNGSNAHSVQGDSSLHSSSRYKP